MYVLFDMLFLFRHSYNLICDNFGMTALTALILLYYIYYTKLNDQLGVAK